MLQKLFGNSKGDKAKAKGEEKPAPQPAPQMPQNPGAGNPFMPANAAGAPIMGGLPNAPAGGAAGGAAGGLKGFQPAGQQGMPRIPPSGFAGGPPNQAGQPQQMPKNNMWAGGVPGQKQQPPGGDPNLNQHQHQNGMQGQMPNQMWMGGGPQHQQPGGPGGDPNFGKQQAQAQAQAQAQQHGMMPGNHQPYPGHMGGGGYNGEGQRFPGQMPEGGEGAYNNFSPPRPQHGAPGFKQQQQQKQQQPNDFVYHPQAPPGYEAGAVRPDGSMGDAHMPGQVPPFPPGFAPMVQQPQQQQQQKGGFAVGQPPGPGYMGHAGSGGQSAPGQSKGPCTVCNSEVDASQPRHKMPDGRYAHLQCFEFEEQQMKQYGGQHPQGHYQHNPGNVPLNLHGSGSGLHNTGGSGGMYGSGSGHQMYGSGGGSPPQLLKGHGQDNSGAGKVSPKASPTGKSVTFGDRTSKGHCVFCKVEIFSDEERARQDDGRYLHLKCHNKAQALAAAASNAPPIPPRTPPDSKPSPPLIQHGQGHSPVEAGSNASPGACIICGDPVVSSQPHKRAKNGKVMHLACLDDDSPSAGKATVMATEASAHWGGSSALPPFKAAPPSTLEGILKAPGPPLPAAGGASAAGLPVFYEQPEGVPSLLGEAKKAASGAEESARAAKAMSGSAATAVLIGGEHSLGSPPLPAGAASMPMPGRGYGGMQNPMAIDFVGGGKADELANKVKEMSVSGVVDDAADEENATMVATEAQNKTTRSSSAASAELPATASSATSAAAGDSVESAASKTAVASRVREEAL